MEAFTRTCSFLSGTVVRTRPLPLFLHVSKRIGVADQGLRELLIVYAEPMAMSLDHEIPSPSVLFNNEASMFLLVRDNLSYDFTKGVIFIVLSDVYRATNVSRSLVVRHDRTTAGFGKRCSRSVRPLCMWVEPAAL